MADNNRTGPDHTQHMPGVHPGQPDLRIVRVDTAQHEPVAQPLDQCTHGVAEEARARPEVARRLRRDIRPAGRGSRIHAADALLHAADLLRQRGLAERPRRLVAHRVVAELVADGHGVHERGFGAGVLELGADDEEGGVGVVGGQDAQDVRRVGRGRVVDRQGDDLGARVGHVEEHVGPGAGEKHDEPGWRLVDCPAEGYDGERCEAEEEEESAEAGAAGSSVEFAGQPEEGEARHWACLSGHVKALL